MFLSPQTGGDGIGVFVWKARPNSKLLSNVPDRDSVHGVTILDYLPHQ